MCFSLKKKYIQTTGRKDFNPDVWVVDLFLCLVRFARVYLENTTTYFPGFREMVSCTKLT